MDNLDLQSLSDIGIAGIATLLILYHFWKDRLYSKMMNNHLGQINQTLVNNISAINKMTEAFKENSRIMERVENMLDKRI